jgi:hypothetical protein
MENNNIDFEYRWILNKKVSSRIHLHENGSFEIMTNPLGNGFFGVGTPVILVKIEKNKTVGKNIDERFYYYSTNLIGLDPEISNSPFRSPRHYYKILASSSSDLPNVPVITNDELIKFANLYNSFLLIESRSSKIDESEYTSAKQLRDKLLKDLEQVDKKIKSFEDEQKSLLFFPEIIDNLTVGPFKLGGPCKFTKEAIDKFGSAIPKINSKEQRIKSITHRDYLYSIVELYSGVKVSINWIEPI